MPTVIPTEGTYYLPTRPVFRNLLKGKGERPNSDVPGWMIQIFRVSPIVKEENFEIAASKEGKLQPEFPPS